MVDRLYSFNRGYDINLLNYFLSMHNGVVKNEQHLKNFVAAGIGIKSEEDSAIICETAVIKYLNELDKSKIVDKRDKIMVDHYGVQYSGLAEEAISMKLLGYRGTIKQLLFHEWKTKTRIPYVVERLLDDFNINLNRVGSFNELKIKEAHTAFHWHSILWRGSVLISRTRLRIPDIMFAVRHIDREFYCLVSIQVKTWNTRPHPIIKESGDSKDRFDDIVLNTSRTHFLSGTSRQQNPLTATWDETLRHYEIYHVRIIISFSGFTLPQIQMVDYFNENYPDQPILLIWPSIDNFPNLYGELQYHRIRELCTLNDPWTKGHTKISAKEDEKNLFNGRVKMALLPRERPEIAIQETEKTKTDSEELLKVKTDRKRTIITDTEDTATESKKKKHKIEAKVPKVKQNSNQEKSKKMRNEDNAHKIFTTHKK